MSQRTPAARALGDIRHGLHSSRDPRAIRTRSAILTAVNSLLADDTSAPITVTDILDRAHIGRTSFYSHFANLGQVALAVFTEDFGESDTATGVSTRPFAIADLVDHYMTHARLYRSVLSTPFSHDISTSTVEVLAAALARSRSGALRAARPRQLPEMFWASALIGTLDAWLRGVLSGSRDDMVTALQELVPGTCIHASKRGGEHPVTVQDPPPDGRSVEA